MGNKLLLDVFLVDFEFTTVHFLMYQFGKVDPPSKALKVVSDTVKTATSETFRDRHGSKIP